MKKISIFLCFAVIFASLFGGSVYASTIDTLPSLPMIRDDDNPDHYKHVVFTVGNDFFAGALVGSDFKSLPPDNISFDINTDTNVLRYYVQPSYSCRYALYQLIDGVWVRQGSAIVATAGYHSLGDNVNSLVYSDYDIYDQNGEKVFPLPLTLAEVIQGEMVKLQTKTVGTMKILTACGVGLLALLIGLVLLPKILYRFL